MAGWLKAIIIIACVIVGLALIAGIIILLLLRSLKNMAKYVEFNNTPVDPEEVTVGNGDKKAIIIYQSSKNGGTDAVANTLAEQLKGYTVTLNHPSDKLEYNLNDYDLIIFGTAIYANEPSECLVEYIQSNSFSDKTVIVFATGIRLNEMEAVDKVKNCIGGINDVYAIKAQKTELDKFKNYLKKCIDK